tara:strand:- start:55342 stop:55518 length:177 start_codon:yes stop_codon:yes gene_type:complete
MTTDDDDTETTYHITLAAERGQDRAAQMRAIRLFLKRAWRCYRLRCTAITTTPRAGNE